MVEGRVGVSNDSCKPYLSATSQNKNNCSLSPRTGFRARNVVGLSVTRSKSVGRERGYLLS